MKSRVNCFTFGSQVNILSRVRPRNLIAFAKGRILLLNVSDGESSLRKVKIILVDFDLLILVFQRFGHKLIIWL